MSDEGALAALAELLAAEEGLLAAALDRSPSSSPGTSEPGRALALEAVREGYLVHYGRSRLLDQADRDLALLAGDRLYALGLERLVDLGDLQGVAELADLISACAAAQAGGRPADADRAWADLEQAWRGRADVGCAQDHGA